MAAVGPTKVNPRTWKWTGIGAESTSAHTVNDSTTSIRVQMLGTFGGTVTLEGSFDGGTTYTALADINGNSIAKTAAAIETTNDVPRLIRVTGGAGTTAVDVWITEVPG